MKKFIIGIIALLTLCSCSCESETWKKIHTTDGATLYVHRFEYDGHKYIEFTRFLEVYDNHTGYVHDPDCPCHENK